MENISNIAARAHTSSAGHIAVRRHNWRDLNLNPANSSSINHYQIFHSTECTLYMYIYILYIIIYGKIYMVKFMSLKRQ